MTEMRQVEDFPFASLPSMTDEEVSLFCQASDLYTLMEDRTDVLLKLLESMKGILQADFKAELAHVEALALEDVMSALPERFLMSVMRMDPHTKRAFLVFDTALAQILVAAVLSGKSALDSAGLDQLKPLSPLSEAVVEYVLVSALEKLPAVFGEMKFTPSFESLVRDPKKLLGLFAMSDRFAVFSIKLTVGGSAFFLKFALPLALAQTLGSRGDEEEFFRSRLQGFESFKTEFFLEIGRVALSQGEVANLEPGDIVLLDECHASLDLKRELTGKAHLIPVGVEDESGFVTELGRDGDQILAKVTGVL